MNKQTVIALAWVGVVGGAITLMGCGGPKIDDIEVIVEIPFGDGRTDPPKGITTISAYTGMDEECVNACLQGTAPPPGCPDCQENEFKITAYSEGDWAFQKWAGFGLLTVPGDPEARFYLPYSTNVVAHYIERPGMKALNLVNDLGDYLVELGALSRSRDLYDINLDFGDFWISGNDEVRQTGNGIPDLAEIVLLESILKNPSISFDGGAYHSSTWDCFQESRRILSDKVPGLSEAGRNTIAAYLTIGIDDYSMLMKEHVRRVYGVALDGTRFNGEAALMPDRSADGDLHTNRQEWQRIQQQAIIDGNASSGLVNATEFARIALDPDLP